MFTFIRDTVRPPGLHFKRLLSLYRMIGRIFGVVRDDIEHVHRSFFPFLASAGKGELKAHARALDIPEVPFDPAGAFRDRVTQGGAHLEERGYFVEMEHPEVGTLKYPGPGFLIDGVNPMETRHPAPRLGEHNSEVYGGQLGLSVEEMGVLRAARVI